YIIRLCIVYCHLLSFFFFDTLSTPAIYPLSLHDALPIFIHDLPDRFLLMNGDVLTDLSFRRFYDSHVAGAGDMAVVKPPKRQVGDRKSTRLNSSHDQISYAVFCLKKKKKKKKNK